MGKRGRKVLLVSVGAAVVTVVACALVFREQPPYEFLRGAERVETIIRDRGGVTPAGAQSKYISRKTVEALLAAAGEELGALGWEHRDTQFVPPGGFLDGFINVLPGDAWEEEHLRGKSVVLVVAPATQSDRFRAWLDRVTGR